ncbi:MAG: oligosaccharide flippase family protein, partial [Planctomycetota bacterium]
CTALAWPLAAHYEASDAVAADLRRLLPVAALALVVSGFQSTRLATASRNLALGRVTVLELVAQAAGIAATAVYALLYHDVMALPVGALVSAVVRCAGSHLVLPGPADRPSWDRDAAIAIVRFGGWIFVSTVASFLAMRLDGFLFPSAFAFDDTGVYSLAVNLSLMVPAVVGSLQLAVVFPLYSRLLERGAQVRGYLERVKRAVFAVAGVLIACTVGGSDALIRLVYDDRWQDAGWMVALLSAGAWFQIVESLYGAALLARGRANLVALANAMKPLVFVAWFCCWPGALDLRAAVLAWAAADVARGLVSMWCASRQGVLTLRLDAVMTAWTLAAAGGLWFLAWHLRDALGCGPVLVLVAVGVAGLVAFAPLLVPGLRTLRQRGAPAGVG